jgi:hypothetical protein
MFVVATNVKEPLIDIFESADNNKHVPFEIVSCDTTSSPSDANQAFEILVEMTIPAHVSELLLRGSCTMEGSQKEATMISEMRIPIKSLETVIEPLPGDFTLLRTTYQKDKVVELALMITNADTEDLKLSFRYSGPTKAMSRRPMRSSVDAEESVAGDLIAAQFARASLSGDSSAVFEDVFIVRFRPTRAGHWALVAANRSGNGKVVIVAPTDEATTSDESDENSNSDEVEEETIVFTCEAPDPLAALKLSLVNAPSAPTLSQAVQEQRKFAGKLPPLPILPPTTPAPNLLNSNDRPKQAAQPVQNRTMQQQQSIVVAKPVSLEFNADFASIIAKPENARLKLQVVDSQNNVLPHVLMDGNRLQFTPLVAGSVKVELVESNSGEDGKERGEPVEASKPTTVASHDTIAATRARSEMDSAIGDGAKISTAAAEDPVTTDDGNKEKPDVSEFQQPSEGGCDEQATTQPAPKQSIEAEGPDESTTTEAESTVTQPRAVQIAVSEAMKNANQDADASNTCDSGRGGGVKKTADVITPSKDFRQILFSMEVLSQESQVQHVTNRGGPEKPKPLVLQSSKLKHKPASPSSNNTAANTPSSNVSSGGEKSANLSPSKSLTASSDATPSPTRPGVPLSSLISKSEVHTAKTHKAKANANKSKQQQQSPTTSTTTATKTAPLLHPSAISGALFPSSSNRPGVPSSRPGVPQPMIRAGVPNTAISRTTTSATTPTSHPTTPTTPNQGGASGVPSVSRSFEAPPTTTTTTGLNIRSGQRPGLPSGVRKSVAVLSSNPDDIEQRVSFFDAMQAMLGDGLSEPSTTASARTVGKLTRNQTDAALYSGSDNRGGGAADFGAGFEKPISKTRVKSLARSLSESEMQLRETEQRNNYVLQLHRLASKTQQMRTLQHQRQQEKEQEKERLQAIGVGGKGEGVSRALTDSESADASLRLELIQGAGAKQNAVQRRNLANRPKKDGDDDEALQQQPDADCDFDSASDASSNASSMGLIQAARPGADTATLNPLDGADEGTHGDALSLVGGGERGRVAQRAKLQRAPRVGVPETSGEQPEITVQEGANSNSPQAAPKNFKNVAHPPSSSRPGVPANLVSNQVNQFNQQATTTTQQQQTPTPPGKLPNFLAQKQVARPVSGRAGVPVNMTNASPSRMSVELSAQNSNNSANVASAIDNFSNSHQSVVEAKDARPSVASRAPAWLVKGGVCATNAPDTPDPAQPSRIPAWLGKSLGLKGQPQTATSAAQSAPSPAQSAGDRHNISRQPRWLNKVLTEGGDVDVKSLFAEDPFEEIEDLEDMIDNIDKYLAGDGDDEEGDDDGLSLTRVIDDIDKYIATTLSKEEDEEWHALLADEPHGSGFDSSSFSSAMSLRERIANLYALDDSGLDAFDTSAFRSNDSRTRGLARERTGDLANLDYFSTLERQGWEQQNTERAYNENKAHMKEQDENRRLKAKMREIQEQQRRLMESQVQAAEDVHAIEKGQKVTFNFPAQLYGQDNDLAFKVRIRVSLLYFTFSVSFFLFPFRVDLTFEVVDVDTGEDITKNIDIYFSGCFDKYDGMLEGTDAALTQAVTFQTEYIGRFNVSVSAAGMADDTLREIDSFRFDCNAPYLSSNDDLRDQVARPGVKFETVLRINNFNDCKDFSVKAADDRGMHTMETSIVYLRL